MRKTALLAALASIFAAVLIAAASAAGYQLTNIKGTVNLSEIGGKELYVFSLWGKSSGYAFGPDGKFETEIFDSGPQKLSVKDSSGMTRAMAIALPEDAEGLVFDARSTAEAVLFRAGTVQPGNLYGGYAGDKEIPV